MDSTTPAKKLLALKAYLNNLNSVAIAFSSGVDSTFLLKVAHDVLGDQVVAVTARSCSFPVRELKEAEEFCRKEGIRHITIIPGIAVICASMSCLQRSSPSLRKIILPT